MLESHPEQFHADSDAEQEPANDEGELKTFQKLEGGFRATLKGGALAEVAPLSEFRFFRTEGTKLTELDLRAANDIGLAKDELADNARGEPMVERVAKELDKGEVRGELLKMLEQVFREFGSNSLFIVKKEGQNPTGGKTAGFDTWKLGHIIDFTKGTTFIIPENKEADLEKLVDNGIKVSFGPEAKFHPNLKWDYLNVGKEKHGRMLKYDLHDGLGERQIVFLYGEVKHAGKTANDEKVEEKKVA